ncbi:maleylpyruvate isomerase N-terminal domain-containing protein [Nocardia amamiensis]|uniref:Maleylpyruvate isomerase N-terminal domain-containing protein n=1 Tax=Nocardia amamiensis TaxID=404578 RepID=A0ABS0CY16_9NOCA|nr:maleylpyruvate isomerase N-terminal domain-containing protein [Nocardia amamiensis]MBF6301494.1 maleylpyruvate isomerase N-terminal domain-containing protein [Nocardia amamiensis]
MNAERPFAAMSPATGEDVVLQAFRAESTRLCEVLGELTEAQFALATPCPPWNVAELAVHINSAVARVLAGLAAPAPPRADIAAADYYRPEIFDGAANAERVRMAQRDAAVYQNATAITAAFGDTWRQADIAISGQPADRMITTRWGDGILLSEFMITRVVELVLHGLDIAIALGASAWTTPEAAAVVGDFLRIEPAATHLGWDRPTALAKASGRAALSTRESAELARLNITWRRFG